MIALALLSLGCDLVPGPEQVALVRLEARTPGRRNEAAQIAQSLETLEHRLKRQGVWHLRFEPPAGAMEVRQVRYRGKLTPEQAGRIFGDHRLEFRLLADARRWPDEATALAALSGRVPEGAKLARLQGDNDPRERVLLVREETAFDECDLAWVHTAQDEDGAPAVGIRMSPAAAPRFSSFMKAHVNQPLAILYDGRVLIAPTIQGDIGAEVIIHGSLTQAEVDLMVETLSSGCMPLRPVLVDFRDLETK